MNSIMKELFRTYLEDMFTLPIDRKPVKVPDGVCNVTRKVIEDFNTLKPMDFARKYQCGKTTYLRRLRKLGDPFVNNPFLN